MVTDQSRSKMTLETQRASVGGKDKPSESTQPNKLRRMKKKRKRGGMWERREERKTGKKGAQGKKVPKRRRTVICFKRKGGERKNILEKKSAKLSPQRQIKKEEILEGRKGVKIFDPGETIEGGGQFD